MVDARHKAQTIAEGIHTPISFEYANEAARLAAGPFESYDKNKFALQLDTNTIYVLTGTAPIVWGSVSGSSISGDLDMDGYDIVDVGTVDGVDVSSHAGRHESGGADAIEIADLGTSEVNVLLVLQPDGAGGVVWSVPLGGGDVVGPAGATDNAIALFDAGTGKVIKNSLVTIDGAGNISTPGMVDGYALGTEFYDINAQLNILGGILGGDLSGTLPNPTVVDLSITGEEQGSVLYFNGTNWVQLSPGEDGYALITHNTGANPTWGEVASSSPITSVFGRVGDVIAGIDDYSASQIDNDSTVPGGQVSDALEYLDGYVNHATRHENGGPDEIEISNLGTSENNPLLVLQPDGAGGVVWSVPSGGGDVVGPAGATDNAIALFDAGTGKVIKNSLVTIDGSGNISTPGMVDGYVLGAEFYEINAQLDILGGPLGGDLSGSLPNPSVVDLTIIGEEQGSVLYFDGSNWVQLPPGSDGYALITHDTGANPTWGEVAGSAPVTSVFGRVGDVVAATDDYSASQIDNDSTVTGEQVSDALEYLDGYIGSHIADLNNPHQTSIANIGSGTLAELNLAISDATLDDISGTRTPTAHATSHEEGETDAIDGYQIGIVYVPVNYAAPASPIIGAHIAAIDDALASSGLVDSVFGRVGDVVAVTDDYSASQIDNDSTVAGEQVSDALEYLDGYIGDVYTLTVGGDLSGNLPNPTVTDLSITSEEQGSILYFDGSNWVQLPPGEDGYILTTRDTGANPEWAMEVLKLDQTNPQTIINGQPTFNDGLLFGNSPSVGDFVSGKLYYDELWRTLSLDSGRDVTLQIGQEEWRRVYNNTGSTILNGKAVYTSGVWNGSFPYVATVDLAIANDDAKWQVLGLATQDIEDGYYGFISVRGHINGVNTDAWTAGDVLYLSDTVAGDLSNAEPSPGNYGVRVGRVIRKDAVNGVINVRILSNSKLGDLANVVETSPSLDQVLTFNGVEWVNGNPTSSSASPGIDFFNSTPVITARIAPAGLSQDGTAGNGIQINSLSKTPVTTAEQTQTILASSDTRAGAAWLYDTALGRTSIDAGLWDFTTYVAVSNTGGTNTVTRTVYQVVPGTGTLTFTGGGANSRTATITAAQYDGTYFVPSGTQTLASFIQATSGTDRGIYQITAMTDPAKLVATATVRTGYANETGVTYNIWNRLFSVTSVALTSTSLSQYDTVTSQPAFTIAATDKLGGIMFVTAGGLNRTFTIAYNGTERNTHVSTPLITLHNNLAGLQGGSANERYHISAAQYTVVGNTSGTNTGDNAANSNYANDYRPGGTDVPVADGGTGLSAIAAGSILAANTANVLSAVTSAVGTTFLTNTAGTVSWGDISASQIDNDSTVFGDQVSDALEYLDGYVDHADRHEYGGGDPIDGYQIGLVYAPVNYDPPGTDIIGEHIAGIDGALGEIVGTGYVVGPAIATDNAIVRYDGTTGELVQNSGVLIDNSDNISGVESLSVGATPAQTGAIRLTNNEGIYWAGNTETDFPGDRAYKLKLTIPNETILGDIVNDGLFRVTHISLPDAFLTLNGPQAPQNGGTDIAASLDEFGNTRIPCYVVRCDLDATPANSRVQLWVRRQDVSDVADTDIWLWWGSETATAPAVDADYGRNDVFDGTTGTGSPVAAWGVWLFDEDPSGPDPCYKDVSGNGHGATDGGTVTRVDAMDVRGAQCVDPQGWITASHAWAPGTGDFSILWAGVRGVDSYSQCVFCYMGGTVTIANIGGVVENGPALPEATGTGVGFVRDGAQMPIYVDTSSGGGVQDWSSVNVSLASPITLEYQWRSGTTIRTFIAFLDTAVNSYWFRSWRDCVVSESTFWEVGTIDPASPAVENVRGIIVDANNDVVVGDVDNSLVLEASDSISNKVDGYEVLGVYDGYVDVTGYMTVSETINGVYVENHSDRHEYDGADPVDGYDVALVYSPTNYDPPGVDIIGEHIANIDGALGEIVDSGYVVGPAIATDNAIVRYDGITGELVQNSGVLIDNLDNISGAESLAIGDVPAQTGAVRLTNNEGIYWAGITEIDFPGNRQWKFALTIPSENILGDIVNDGLFRKTHVDLPDAFLTLNGAQAPQNGGADIAASLDEFGLTRIPCYVVRCDLDATPANSRVHIWFRRQDVSNVSDTVIWLWWGDALATPPAVDANYGRNDVFNGTTGTGSPVAGWGVWLYDEDPTDPDPCYKDHSGNSHDAYVAGTVTRVDSMSVRGAQNTAEAGGIRTNNTWAPGTADFSILWAGVLGTADEARTAISDGSDYLYTGTAECAFSLAGVGGNGPAVPTTASGVCYVRDGDTVSTYVNASSDTATGFASASVSLDSTFDIAWVWGSIGTNVSTFNALLDTAVNPYWFRSWRDCIVSESTFWEVGTIEAASPTVENVRGIIVDANNDVVIGDVDNSLILEASDSITFNVDGYEIVSIYDGYVDVANNDIRSIKTATFNEWPTLTPDEDGYVTVDFGSYQKATIDLNDEASIYIILSNPLGPASFTIILQQGASVASTIIDWQVSNAIYGPSGTIGYSTDLESITLVKLEYNGSDWFVVSTQSMEPV